MKQLRIGYIPNRSDLSHLADRRRDNLSRYYSKELLLESWEIAVSRVI